ncbi:DUF6531 domain-containing protein [Cupriavidus necator]|uniref:DUF6531 domain-containing protein n=1 Tax=Cupriavidus necator TaxID=106590 RepID=UPI00339D6F26
MACSAIGNPVLPGAGQKIASETDFADIRNSLSFRRNYSSKGLKGGSLGDLWIHNWERRIDAGTHPAVTDQLTVIRGDGTRQYFVRDATTRQWQPSYAYEKGRLNGRSAPSGETVGWEYIAEDDSIESYSASGQLLSVTTRAGAKTILAYSDAATPPSIAPAPGLLIAIADQFGRTLKLSYNADKRVNAITSPAGEITSFEYSVYGMLSKVVWPDARFRTYVYEDTRFPSALTGIIDEAGTRFGIYAYDAAGRAISSEHAGGVNRFQFQYLTGSTTSVTTPGGSNTTLSFEQTGDDFMRSTGASASCPECGKVAKNTSYDANGNVSGSVDFDNKETRYTYDALGRETQRIEDYSTPDPKTTTTEWHPTWKLPLKVAAPGRVDYFTYDARGQMTAHGWFPTADANGSQGLGAAPSGTVSSNGYGYDTNGLMTALVEQVDGTVTQQWTFGYDVQGNLTSATDGTGRTSRAVHYDPAGRLLEAVDLEGVTVKYVYDQRGRVLQYLYGDNVTAYVYNAIGQKIQVTSPNGDVTNYTYDAAHRLIDVLLNGQSLTGPDPDEQQLTLAKTTSENAGSNPFSAWMGWISKLFNWLFGSAHAQAVPAPVTAVGASMSIPGTYTPSPWDVLAPNLGGKKPWEWMAIWTSRLIETCSGNSPKTDHRGRIQAQGPGYRDEGAGDVEAWAQEEPLTAASGLAKLEALEGRMTKKQYLDRSQALARAKRFVVNASRGGGTGPTRQSFRNDEVIVVNGSERIDIEVQKGMAFVP